MSQSVLTRANPVLTRARRWAPGQPVPAGCLVLTSRTGAQRLSRRSEADRDALLHPCLDLPGRIARGAGLVRWAARLLGPDEAIQVGLVALWRAAERYDPARGMAFRVYAGGLIVQDLLRAGKREARARAQPLTEASEPVAPRASDTTSLDAVLARCLPREREVLQLRAQEWTFDAIGVRLGVSKQRAGAIYQQGLERARRAS